MDRYIDICKSNQIPAPGKKVNGTIFTNVQHKMRETNIPRAACLMQLGLRNV